MRHKANGKGSEQYTKQATLLQARPVAAVFTVAGAILHKDVVAARAHQAEAFVALNTGFAHVGTAAEVTPFPMHLLPDLAAHGRTHALQMLQLWCLLTVRNSQCAIVEGVTALGIVVGATVPAFDAISWGNETSLEN